MMVGPEITATEVLMRHQVHPDIVRLHMDRRYIRQKYYWPDNPDNFLKPGIVHEAPLGGAVQAKDHCKLWAGAEGARRMTVALGKRPSILRRVALMRGNCHGH